MATYEAEAAPIVITDPNERTAAKISRAVAKTPLHLFLAFVALLWLMPTLGLFFTSLLSFAQERFIFVTSKQITNSNKDTNYSSKQNQKEREIFIMHNLTIERECQ